MGPAVPGRSVVRPSGGRLATFRLTTPGLLSAPEDSGDRGLGPSYRTGRKGVKGSSFATSTKGANLA